MDVQRQVLLTLVRSGLTGERLPLPEGFDLERIYPELIRHQVLTPGYLGAVNCGVSKQDPVMVRMFRNYCQYLRRSEQQQSLIEKICAAFDEIGVDYMPLKGCNLKGLYPTPELRTMGDADILIRVEQYDRIRPVLSELGFEKKVESDHELIWRQEHLTLELHKRLIPSYNRDYYRHFGDGWRLATHRRGTRWAMSCEEEFVYLFTHFAKHYRDGGIGLRHLADLWIFLRAYPGIDKNYIRTELRKLKLMTFYDNVIKTVDAWFGSEAWDEVSCFIIQYICGSGAYGTKAGHNVAAVVRDMSGNKTVARARLTRARKIIFPAYGGMKEKYPILNRLPALLPVLWLVRVFEVLLIRRDKLQGTVQKLREADAQAVGRYQRALDFVGLNFDFEE